MEKALKPKGVTREQLWRQYISDHPDGYRLSQFKEYYRRWTRVSQGTMHIDHKAGDKMNVDYAGNKLEIIDPSTGEVRKVEVFVAILDRLVQDAHRIEIEGDSMRKNRKIKNT